MNVFVAAKGHPYLRDPFMAMFDDMQGVSATLVEQPVAAQSMNSDDMKGFDALVLYDMPGVDFRVADPPRYVEPGEDFKKGFRALLDQESAWWRCTMRSPGGRPGKSMPSCLAGGFFTSRESCAEYNDRFGLPARRCA